MAEQEINVGQLRKVRLEKIDKLRESGVEPYGQRFDRDTRCAEIKERYDKYLRRYIKEAVEAAIKREYFELIEVFIKNKLIEKSAFPQILSTVEEPQYNSLKNQLVEYYEKL